MLFPLQSNTDIVFLIHPAPIPNYRPLLQVRPSTSSLPITSFVDASRGAEGASRPTCTYLRSPMKIRYFGACELGSLGTDLGEVGRPGLARRARLPWPSLSPFWGLLGSIGLLSLSRKSLLQHLEPLKIMPRLGLLWVVVPDDWRTSSCKYGNTTDGPKGTANVE